MTGHLFDICDERDGMPAHHPTKEGSQLDGRVVDIAEWSNFLTFDMTGESYECLETSTYHPWVNPIVELTHYSGILANLGFYPKF
jgi:hypothetical protein